MSIWPLLSLDAPQAPRPSRSPLLRLRLPAVGDGRRALFCHAFRLVSGLLLGALLLGSVAPADGWAQATEDALLRASNANASDFFGRSVALDGRFAIVGAPAEDDASNQTPDAGAAYIFERQADGTWTEVALLRAGTPRLFEGFGASVSIDDGRAVVGVPNRFSATGAAVVYEEQPDGTWAEVAQLRASNARLASGFGGSVSLDGDRILVGTPGEDNATGQDLADFGAAYVFERQPDGTWAETALLRASNAGSQDVFGRSVSISGERAVVGAEEEDGASDSAFGSGAAYVFERQTDGTWVETALLRVSSVTQGGSFGTSVAIDGPRVVVGAPTLGSGAAYVFTRQADGTWAETDLLRASNAEDRDEFGFSVGISGERVVVGAIRESGPSEQLSEAGAAYVFREQAGGIWEEAALLRASNADASDFFGFSVAIDGDHALVGAEREDSASNQAADAGTVYAFGPSKLPVELTAFGAVANDGGARLTWQTASETGNAGFEIQHQRPAAATWARLDFVESRAPSGTTTEPQAYRFDVGTLEAGTHRFRLRQVDLDGTESLSAPVALRVQMTRAAWLSPPAPHPVADRATIAFAVRETAETTVALYDLLGRRVKALYRGTPRAGETRRVALDTRGLASGTYVVRLQAGASIESQPVTVVQ